MSMPPRGHVPRTPLPTRPSSKADAKVQAAKAEAQRQARITKRAESRGVAKLDDIVLERTTEREVWRRKVQGQSTREIAEALQVPSTAVHNAVLRGLDDLAIDTARDTKRLRALEATRLDALQASVWGRAVGTDGNPLGQDAGIDRVLKVMDRRAKLLGLDTPVVAQTEVTVRKADELSDAELEAIIKDEDA